MLEWFLKALNIENAADIFAEITGVSPQNLLQFLIRLAVAIVVYIFVCKLIDYLCNRVLHNVLKSKGVDESGLLYGTSIVKFGARIILVFVLINMVGVQSTALTAVTTAIAAGITFGSQDIIKDFIGGMSLMMTRPFAVKDYIIVPGVPVEGFVKKITMFHVILRGRGDRTFTIPNGIIFRSNIINMTAEGHWLMELMVGITYEDNIGVARSVMLEEANKEPLVLKDRAPEVILSDLGESSVNLLLLAWTNKEDHFPVYWHLLEEIKIALEAHGITIAYNQLDVHLDTKETGENTKSIGDRKVS